MADLVILSIGGSLDKVSVEGSMKGVQCHWSFVGHILGYQKYSLIIFAIDGSQKN